MPQSVLVNNNFCTNSTEIPALRFVQQVLVWD